MPAINSCCNKGMSAVRIVMALWAGFFLVLGPLHTPGDGDLYWQQWLGDVILRTHQLPVALGSETFTSVGAHWVPHEWLFSTLVALAAQHEASFLLAILVSAIPALILVSIYLRSRATAGPEAIAVVLLLCGLALVEWFGIRAQVLGWACIAALFYCLERRDRWYYAAIPVVVIWANLHASVMVAPVIILARIAGAAMGHGWRGMRDNRDVRILLPVVLATFCTPLGWHLPIYAFTLIGSPIRHFIQEWQSPGLGDASFVFGALPLAVLAVSGGGRSLARNGTEVVPAAVLFIAMFFASRNVPLFAIAVAPLAARAVDLRSGTLLALGKCLQAMEAFALTAICIAILLSGILLLWDQRVSPPRLPIAAIESASADHSDRRVFCEDFAWCSVALLYPRLRVFIDGRCDPYPVNVWRSYIATINVSDSWDETLQRYRIDTVIVARSSRFARALASDASWRRSFEDAAYAVYTRAT